MNDRWAEILYWLVNWMKVWLVNCTFLHDNAYSRQGPMYDSIIIQLRIEWVPSGLATRIGLMYPDWIFSFYSCRVLSNRLEKSSRVQLHSTSGSFYSSSVPVVGRGLEYSISVPTICSWRMLPVWRRPGVCTSSSSSSFFSKFFNSS